MRVRHASSSCAGERQELVERRVAAGASAERTAREDQRRIERERAEQPVDVVGDAERGAARMRVERRDEHVGRGLDDRVLVRGQEAQARGQTADRRRRDLARGCGTSVVEIGSASASRNRRGRLVELALRSARARVRPSRVSATVRTRRSVACGAALGEAVLLEPVDEPRDVRRVALPASASVLIDFGSSGSRYRSACMRPGFESERRRDLRETARLRASRTVGHQPPRLGRGRR